MPEEVRCGKCSCSYCRAGPAPTHGGQWLSARGSTACAPGAALAFFESPSPVVQNFMKRFWLLFSQTVTVFVAAYFVVATLQPSWLQRGATRSSAGIALIEAPPVNASLPAPGSFSPAARKAAPAVVSINTSKAAVRNPRSDDPWFQFFFGDQGN